MKLIGDLKKKVDKANTKEEAKELIANAGMELTEEEMDAVSGGRTFDAIEKCLCPKCGHYLSVNPSQSHYPSCPDHPNNKKN